MPEPVVIDLGEVRGHPEPEPAGSPPRRYRAVAVAAVVAALLVALGGARPVPVALTEVRVPVVTGETMDVIDDRLYVVTPHHNVPRPAGPPGEDRTLTAYRLPDGRRLWRSRVPDTGPEFHVYGTVGDMLLLSLHGQTTEIIAVDRATGAYRWRRTGWPFGSTEAGPDRPTRLLLVSSDTDSSQPETQTVSAVNPATGAVLWSYHLPVGSHLNAAINGTFELFRLVIGHASGRVDVLDPATGRRVGGAVLRPPVSPPGSAPTSEAGQEETAEETAEETRTWLSMAGDLVLVASGDGLTVTAYAVSDLTRRWELRLRQPLPIGWLGAWHVQDDLLFLHSMDEQVQAIDRQTGRTAWSGSWGFVERAGRWLLAGRFGAGLDDGVDLTLIDPATGRVHRRLGTWTMLSRRTPGEPMLSQHDPGAARAWFGLLEHDAGRVRLVGVAEGVLRDCQAGRGVVVCRRVDSTIGIWAYR